MDLVAFVDIRRKRYVATTLEDFEQRVERELKRSFNGDIPPAVRDAMKDYKASVRKKFQAFAEDFTDIVGATNFQVNAAALELLTTQPHGRETT